MMRNLNDRVREAILASGKSQAEIAREMGITQSAITQWLSGKTKSLKIETALALEKATGVVATWIATGLGPKLLVEKEAISAVETPLVVPLYTWRQAAGLANGSPEVPLDDHRPHLASPVDHSECAYALEVRGASMSNSPGPISFSEKDALFVERYLEPENGSFVIARIDNEEEATFRQLMIEGASKYLHALNPAWPSRIIDFKSHSIEIVGVVIARSTRFS